MPVTAGNITHITANFLLPRNTLRKVRIMQGIKDVLK